MFEEQDTLAVSFTTSGTGPCSESENVTEVLSMNAFFIKVQTLAVAKC